MPSRNTQPTSSHRQALTSARITVATIIFVIGLALFLVMYSSAVHGGIAAGFDRPIHDWMVDHRTPALTLAMELVTNILSPVGFSLMVAGGGALWIWKKRDLWRPLLLAGSLGVAFIITSSIKALVERARPPAVDMVPPLELDFAFPSGHTVGVAVFVLVLGYLAYSARRTAGILAAWAALGALAIIAVAVSRLYLGHHWLTDVSASIGIALIVLAGVIVIDGLRQKRRLTKVASGSDQ